MIELSKIKKKSILVIGDVMLDKYYVGAVKRISPEAPVPVFRKKAERSVLGGPPMWRQTWWRQTRKWR